VNDFFNCGSFSFSQHGHLLILQAGCQGSLILLYQVLLHPHPDGDLHSHLVDPRRISQIGSR
jgi:hypothetical protein